MKHQPTPSLTLAQYKCRNGHTAFYLDLNGNSPKRLKCHLCGAQMEKDAPISK